MSQNLRKGEKIIGDWWQRDTYHVRTDHFSGANYGVTVLSESADYQTRDGFEHRDGAWRVTATMDSGKTYKRRQTFYGELAQSNAQRAFDDLINEVRYSR